MPRKHPAQPVVLDDRGIARFTENKIVRFLLDSYGPGLNDIALRFGTARDPETAEDNRADYEQLMMLIGYSVSGFGDLNCADRRTVAGADRRVENLLKKRVT